MQDTYERVLELLGKCDDDPLFGQFVEDLGELPYILLKTKHATEYMFDKSGLHLSFREGPQSSPSSSVRGFGQAIFSVRKGYNGNLPSDIEPDDSRDAVERKLDMKPSKTMLGYTPGDRDLWEEYDLKPFKLLFIFHASDQMLALFSVSYDPDGADSSKEGQAGRQETDP
jgi:hypothetical protein